MQSKLKLSERTGQLVCFRSGAAVVVCMVGIILQPHFFAPNQYVLRAEFISLILSIGAFLSALASMMFFAFRERYKRRIPGAKFHDLDGEKLLKAIFEDRLAEIVASDLSSGDKEKTIAWVSARYYNGCAKREKQRESREWWRESAETKNRLKLAS